MFNKKKQQSLYKLVDDSRYTVYDFTLRSVPIIGSFSDMSPHSEIIVKELSNNEEIKEEAV